MRSASRPLKPRQPVSMSSDWPEGETTRVAWPPSTSMKYTSWAFAAGKALGAASRQHIARIFIFGNRSTCGAEVLVAEVRGRDRPGGLSHELLEQIRAV